jgi:hypothetical protein
MSHDLYESITAKVIEMLEGGVAPWRSPILGQSKAGWPKNLTTGREYRGVNVFLLAFTAWTQGYSSSHWLTFRQAKERGGHVKKGEKSSMVVFWKQYATTDRETGEAINVPVLRHYLVFNAEQCEGIAIPDAPSFVPSSFEPVYEAERIVRTYQDAPVIAGRALERQQHLDAMARPAVDAQPDGELGPGQGRLEWRRGLRRYRRGGRHPRAQRGERTANAGHRQQQQRELHAGLRRGGEPDG